MSGSAMSPTPVREPVARYPALDGVRGLAIIMVLIWHFVPCLLVNEAGSWAPLVRRLFSTTATGVDLFFALSGFLIAGILLEQKGKPNYFKVFYLRRTARIFPLYFLMLGSFLVFSKSLPIPQSTEQWLFANPMPVWSYALFSQNIFMGIRDTFGAGWLAVTWSLAVEEQFYLIFPILIFLTGERKLAVLCLALFVVLPFLHMGFHSAYTHVNLPWRADALVAGALVAMIVRSQRLTQIIRSKKQAILAAGVVLLAIHLLQLALPKFQGSFEGTLNGLLFGVLILILRLDLIPQLSSLFSNPIMVRMGMLSYGIYMFHQPISGLLHGFIKGQAPRIAGPADMIITLSAAIAAVILAWISHRFFESPFLRFAHRFHYSSRAK